MVTRPACLDAVDFSAGMMETTFAGQASEGSVRMDERRLLGEVAGSVVWGAACLDVDQVGRIRRTRARKSSTVAQSITAVAASEIRQGSDSPSEARSSSATSGPNFISTN